MAFDLENYEPVSARLSRWLDSHPDSRILTEMLTAPGADVCVIKASIWVGDELRATGHAEEVRGAGNVNRTSHVENCETSAIGRALANAGFAGSDPSKRASREEMQKVQRYGGTPATSTENGPRMASDKQKNMIRAIAKSVGGLPPSNIDSLTSSQASRVIDDLKQQQMKREAAGDEEPF